MKTELLVKAIDKGIEALEHLKSALAKAEDAEEAPLVSEADKLKGKKKAAAAAPAEEKPKRTRKAKAPEPEVEDEEELEDEAEEAEEDADDLEDLDDEEDDAPKVDAAMLRTKLVEYAKKHSKEKAYKVLARFSKEKKVNTVKPEDYQKLHDALSK